jgi:hypothetical protein
VVQGTGKLCIPLTGEWNLQLDNCIGLKPYTKGEKMNFEAEYLVQKGWVRSKADFDFLINGDLVQMNTSDGYYEIKVPYHKSENQTIQPINKL